MNLIELPEWVKYVATDKNGLVTGYKRKPLKGTNYGTWMIGYSPDISESGSHEFILLSYEPIGDMSWEDDEPYEVIWTITESKAGFNLVGNSKIILGDVFSIELTSFSHTDTPEPETTESNMSRFAELMEGMSADRYEVFKDLMNDLIDERLRMLGDDDFDENG